MRKLKDLEEIILPCGSKIRYEMTRFTSVARLVSDVDIEDSGNNVGLTELSAKNLSRIRIKKESIKPLIEFLQRLDLTLEG